MDKTKITQVATKYAQRGQYEKAIGEYRKIIAKDPKDVRSLLKIGELQQKKGDNESAAGTLLDVANSYAAEGFFLKAVAVFKQVLKLAPERVDVILRLADLYKQLGLMSEAMAQLHAAAAHYEKSGAMQESVEILRRLIAMEPENVAARLRLADGLARQGSTEEALKELRTTAAKLRGSSRLEDYLRVADRIVILDPMDQALGRELAHAYLAKGDVRRALERLQICFQHDPKNAETLDLLARAFVGVGQRAKAASVYKELARVYGERARGADEQACWRKVLELSPDDAEARQALGAAAQIMHVAPQSIGGARPPAPPLLGDSPGPSARPFVAPSRSQEASFPGARDAHMRGEDAWIGSRPGVPGPDGSRPGVPRVEGSRPGGSYPGAPRPEGSRPGVPRTEASRPSAPRPEGSRPGVPRVEGSRPGAPRPDASRPSAPRPEASRPNEPAEPAPLAKLLTETDVFVKYGLNDKARLHLQKIFAIDPDCIAAHEKAVDLLRTRDPARHLVSLAALARLHVRDGDMERGRPHFDELRSLAPSHADVQELAPIYGGQAGAEENADDLILEGTPGPMGLDALPDELFTGLPLQDEPLLLPIDVDEEAVELDVSVFHQADRPSFDPVGDDALFALASDSSADEVVDEPLLFDPSLGPDTSAQQEALRLLARDQQSRGPAIERTIDVDLEPPPPEQTIDLFGDEDEDDQEPTRAAPGADPFADDRTGLALIDVEESYEPTEIVRDDALDRTPAFNADETAEVNFDAVTAAHAAGLIRDEVDRATPAWRSEEGLAPEPTPIPTQDPVNPWRVEPSELDEMAGELDEAEFYLQQGLLDEAEEIFRSVERRVPGHAQAVGRLVEISGRRGKVQGAPPPESTVFDRALSTPSDDGLDGELFDLGAALAEEIADSAPAAEPSAAFQYSAEDVLQEFRAGVARTVRPEDVDTHYNLAIAYKEMGLLPDAISAFEQALSGCEGDARAVDCLTMIGMCHTMQGQHLHAVRAFTRGLDAVGANAETEKALHYEIGLAYEAAGDKNEALTSFGRAARLDGTYRDVKATIARLVGEGAVPRTPGPVMDADAPAGIAHRAGSR